MQNPKLRYFKPFKFFDHTGCAMEDRPKKPTAPEILSKVPRKDTYDKSHGAGNPRLQPGELQTSETWKSHKPAKQVKPTKA